jgi:predicted lipoprotein with Yx(FWY)xxD motif
MRSPIVATVLLSAVVGLAACGGGGYTAPAALATPTPPVTPPTTPTTTLSEATLLGSAGFVSPATSHTVYALSGDSPTALTCTTANTCTAAWFPVVPPAGVTLTTGFTSFTRTDTATLELAYLGHPLYTYIGDSASGQTTGNLLVSFGGTWTITRP